MPLRDGGACMGGKLPPLCIKRISADAQFCFGLVSIVTRIEMPALDSAPFPVGTLKSRLKSTSSEARRLHPARTGGTVLKHRRCIFRS
jgi:hypothetical protein